MRYLLTAICLLAAPFAVSAQTSPLIVPPLNQQPAAQQPIQPLSEQQPKHALNDDLLYRLVFGRPEDIAILLDKGADPNTVSPEGDTALTIALGRNDELSQPMAKVLLEKGADPNLPDKQKNYPLIMAIKYNMPDIIALMVDKGVHFDTRIAPGDLTGLEFARNTGKLELYKPMQDVVDKANAEVAATHSPERRAKIIYQYGYYSCVYEYWNYVLSSRQMPDKEIDIQKKINDSRILLADLVDQIQKFFPYTSSEGLQNLSDNAASKLSDELDKMISNHNRGDHGVGHEDDSRERCTRIVATLDMNIENVAPKTTQRLSHR